MLLAVPAINKLKYLFLDLFLNLPAVNVVTYKMNFLNIALVFLCVFLFGVCRGQSIQDIKNDAKTYFWGEGSGSSLKKADHGASAMLISQIAVQAENRAELFGLGTGEDSLEPVKDTAPYRRAVEQLKNAINSRRYKSAKRLFTASGYAMFRKLVQYGRSKILEEKELKFLKNGDAVLCRPIPMSFSFKNNQKEFVEEVVLEFDRTHKINSLSLSLGDAATANIAHNDAWPKTARWMMIRFMENYKTAYALKRLDYIERIFSDDALIITGVELKAPPNEVNRFQDNQIVKYNKYTKLAYLKKLKFAFSSKEFINLKFDESAIRKSGKGGEIYGIQIKQSYVSPNYADSGYLFLLIDFNEPEKPTIHVRTWQPKKGPHGEIYGISDFN